jgi:hypothetical protein
MPERPLDEVGRLFGGWPTGAPFLDDSSQAAEGVVGFFGSSECSGYVGVENHHLAAGDVPRRVFVASGLTEIVLRKYRVDGASIGYRSLS